MLTRLLFVAIGVSLAFPKAGLKVGGIPLTVANGLIALLLVGCAIAFLSGGRIPKSSFVNTILMLTGYFAFRLIGTLLTGEAVIDAFTALVVSPLIAIIVVALVRDDRAVSGIAGAFVFGFWVVVVYGLLQAVTGIGPIAIPGLTVNLTDWLSSSTWYLEKHNAVRDDVKLVSTYQNGNLLGVNLLLMFPIAYEGTRSAWRPLALAAFVAVGFLTLSRSVWVGVVIVLLVRFVFWPMKTRQDLLLRIFSVGFVVFAIPAVLLLFPQVASRLFSTQGSNLFDLSGRAPWLVDLVESSSRSLFAVFLGPHGFIEYAGSANEITLAAVYRFGGLIGVALMLVATLAGLSAIKPRQSPFAKASLLSAITYLLVSLVEGAYWLPPTAIVFWTVLGVGVAASRAPVTEHEGVTTEEVQLIDGSLPR